MPRIPMPAIETAVKQDTSPLRRILAVSLACYTSEDDADMDRRSFLEVVRDRIEMDLSTGEY